MSAITLVLVTVGASVSLSSDSVSGMGQQTSVADLPHGWVNRGVMACALIQLAFSGLVLTWDLIDCLWYAIETAIAARSVLKENPSSGREGDEGRAAATAEASATQSTKLSKMKTRERVVV
jgi:hypothetical protein